MLEDVGVRSGNVQHGRYALLYIARSDYVLVSRSKPIDSCSEGDLERLYRFIENSILEEQRTTIFLNTDLLYLAMTNTELRQHHSTTSASRLSRLSTPQSALLVGMIRLPTFYSPAKHPDRALARRNEVLEAMKAQGSLSAGDAVAAEATPLGVRQ